MQFMIWKEIELEIPQLYCLCTYICICQIKFRASSRVNKPSPQYINTLTYIMSYLRILSYVCIHDKITFCSLKTTEKNSNIETMFIMLSGQLAFSQNSHKIAPLINEF